MPVTIDGAPVKLATITYKPAGGDQLRRRMDAGRLLDRNNDPFYRIAHTRANFAAFQAAGGRGTFHEYAPPAGLNGHQINSAPALWSATMETYLMERGLPGRPR